MEQLLIGIAGPSAGGKSTVANKIVSKFSDSNVIIINLDDYYNDQSHMKMEERVKTNYDHPQAFDIDLLIKHVKDLVKGKSIEKPTYDFVSHNRSEISENINPTDIIIIEGLFTLYRQELFDMFDIKIYVEAESDVCFIRRLKRDMEERGRSMESVINQYLTSVRPMYKQFIKPTRENADIIIPNGGENKVAIDIVQKTINDHLIGGNNNE